MVDRIRVNLPVARIVQGDLYKANDKDMKTGQPRVYPPGHRLAGQPKITYFFALAIKKQGEQHWSQTSWGQPIWALGYAAWPKLVDQNPNSPRRGYLPDDFAWKIEDGDDQKPHKPQGGRPGRVNAQTEGMPGHWIVGCSSVYPPKIIDSGFAPITEPSAVKRGFWVEAVVSVDSNETDGNPGIYVNGEFVMFRAIDKELGGQAIDPRSIAGFGQSALPAGLQAVGALPPSSGAPASVPAPGVPGFFPGQQIPAPAGAMPSPAFPTPGTPPATAGLSGAPAAFPHPVGAPFAFPSGAAFLPGGAPPAAFGATGSASGMTGQTPPNAQTAGYPSNPPFVQLPPGVTSVPGFLPTGAPATGGPVPVPAAPALAYPSSIPNVPAVGAAPFGGPTLTAKALAIPGLTWDAMAKQGWTVDAARAQGYVQ